ncbi:hypothetical protein [Natrarchaeobaculum aegyptiacum]|uniref:Thymidylate synthase n=1 Tax=Natrarchaeobaculum aegyptiacum TaxID=745377 RepID=A0A2Z2HU73_9EURY|nr:hypothetical protein [Natrarchaeobaculum aegyptiacum]ARS90791.1 hypothetical protein B1756_14385 [Natrarchaeobaculum aegyptiacum]
MVPANEPPHIIAPDIGTAYTELLESRVEGQCPYDYHVIHIADPVSTTDYDEFSLERTNWTEIVNAGDALSRFESYEFNDGSAGRYWLQDRVEELFEGLYGERLTGPPNQIEMIVDRLDQGNHGQTTNALVAQPYQLEPDLEKATHGRPLAADIPCLTQLQFKPRRDKLHLYTTFRSQYVDTKCYGNLISLALLLAEVCRRTEYDPGYMVEGVHNPIFRNSSDGKGLASKLSETSTK